MPILIRSVAAATLAATVKTPRPWPLSGSQTSLKPRCSARRASRIVSAIGASLDSATPRRRGARDDVTASLRIASLATPSGRRLRQNLASPGDAVWYFFYGEGGHCQGSGADRQGCTSMGAGRRLLKYGAVSRNRR